ncbi:MAG: metallopeptidase family protein [Eubacterium sp.]|nr:metallopeptidase family protein [Eubacterium sp.]
MMTFDEFAAIAEEETAALPSYVYDELNGGVVVDPNACLHPARLEDDLYILGTYSSSPVMGKQIVLYYGSFTASLGNAGETVYREQIRETIRHEFRHHLETRAGLFGAGTLVEEDKEKMLTYFMRHAR